MLGESLFTQLLGNCQVFDSSGSIHLRLLSDAPRLNHKNIRSPTAQCQRNWSIFFVMVSLPREDDGAKNKRLSSGRFLRALNIGLMKNGRAAWQEKDETRKDFSIVLMLQEKFFTSELFKVIQDAISLIILYRTMSWFWTVSSSTFITLDVQSIYIPSMIQDWYPEVKIWANDRQYSFCLWILWTRNTKIRMRLIWTHRVLHNTCMKHGRNIKTRCIGSISNLLKRKDWSFIRRDWTLSFFTRNTPSLLYSESC